MLPFVPKLLWVDLEMSGLDPLKNQILEFACILTDDKVTIEQEGPHLIMHCDQEHLQTMDEWNTTYLLVKLSHHTKSGLYQSCLNSNITIQQAE